MRKSAISVGMFPLVVVIAAAGRTSAGHPWGTIPPPKRSTYGLSPQPCRDVHASTGSPGGFAAILTRLSLHVKRIVSEVWMKEKETILEQKNYSSSR